MNTVTVLPKATVTKEGYDGKPRDYRVRSVDLDANENMFGETLHVVTGVDHLEQRRWWYETTDSLKALFDVATGND